MSDPYMPLSSVRSGMGFEAAKGVHGLTVQIVNVYFVQNPSQPHEFVLIDAGMPKSAGMIIKEAKQRFGDNCTCKAIILTHGHFDHIGAIEEILEQWKVPVYVHEKELPYVTGQEDYPPARPDSKSGLVAKLSPLFPRHSINISSHVHTLPEDGSVPFLEEWEWLFTPGHTPGHISLFRESGRVLLAGDAVITVEQESLADVVIQKQELHGPPAYFTMDPALASESIQRLAKLEPEALLTGHGIPMTGRNYRQDLSALAERLSAIT
ncbi:MBL fold metallo-hydrolase [Bacillus atrophaeus]|uniref:MBL fold metallo-hydrolase n=1 Tax=Bacillus atrophaeus TaxID=1452 RepID=UPI00227ECB27|nr:MBL fold metallo-hydrolase [Bacillus atrophaeus]MCY8519010.1 MBL fold metallo-hydrolase [Bacillus atrophaeus]